MYLESNDIVKVDEHISTEKQGFFSSLLNYDVYNSICCAKGIAKRTEMKVIRCINVLTIIKKY